MQMATINTQAKMADIHFRCPFCSKRLVVDGRYGGDRVDCPRCAEAITIPDPRRPVSPDVLQEMDKLRRTLADANARARTNGRKVEAMKKALDEAQALAGRAKGVDQPDLQAALKREQEALTHAKEALVQAEKGWGKERAALEEALKREKAALALETQAHHKREQEAEEQARAAEVKARTARESLEKEVEAKTAEAGEARAELQRLRASDNELEATVKRLKKERAEQQAAAKESQALKSEVEQLRGELDKSRAAAKALEAEVADLRQKLKSAPGKAVDDATPGAAGKRLKELQARLEEADKDKTTLFEELAALRLKMEEKDAELLRKEAEIRDTRAGRGRPGAALPGDFALGQMRLVEQQLTDRLDALKALLEGEEDGDEVTRTRAEADRLAKAHAVQMEVQRLERKLRDQHQAAASRSCEDMEEREKALTEEIADLRRQLEAKDRSMREVVDGERTSVDLSRYANPALERVAAAQGAAGADAEDEAPADGRLAPLKSVGDDIVPRFTSPRPYYGELPVVKPQKSWVLSLGWILAAFGIVTMILSPVNLLVVYGPPVALAFLLGLVIWPRRRTPMVAGLIFVTLLIPAMVWFGVEEGQFKGLAPDIGENLKVMVIGAD
jgi:hypothetical protein